MLLFPMNVYAENYSDETENSPVATVVTGWPGQYSAKSRKVLKLKVDVNCPAGRKIFLEEYANGWKTKKTISLQNKTTPQKVTISFPNNWWRAEKTFWRLCLEENDQAKSYVSQDLTLTTMRYYQNPAKYIQISNSISKHGLRYYTQPVQVNNISKRSKHVNAVIKTAKKYLGNKYVVCRSDRPGRGVDCSGLVMQAFYAAGVDLWPSNPHRHRSRKFEYESREIAKMKKLKTVSYANKKKGDLIFYCNRWGTINHVAIYLGGGKIIHSYPPRVQISKIKEARFGKVALVKRVFVSR